MSMHTVHSVIMFASSGPDSSDDFDAFLDEVTDQLYGFIERDGGMIDPVITGSLANRTIDVIMDVEADSKRDAVRLFAANVRAALHAAECATPGWPTFKPASEPEPQLVDA